MHFFERCAGIGCLQERAKVDRLHPLPERLQVGIQIHDHPQLVHDFDVLGPRYDAAPGHDDTGPLPGQIFERGRFCFAKPVSSELGEDVCNRDAEFRGNDVVEFDPRQFRHFFERFADGGFPASHEAN